MSTPELHIQDLMSHFRASCQQKREQIQLLQCGCLEALECHWETDGVVHFCNDPRHQQLCEECVSDYIFWKLSRLCIPSME